MRNLADWSLRKKAMVHLLAIVWIGASLFGWWSIRRELFPEISFDSITITTILPGATPEDVERLVTDPIEDAVVDLSGLDHVESVSTEGRSEITVFVDPDAATVDEVLRDVERAVDLVQHLPDEAEEPQIVEKKFEAPVLVAAILTQGGGDAPWETRKRLADRLEDRFRAVPGVSSVVVAGLPEREILVEVDPERLAARRISSGDVVNAIRAARVDLPGGLLETPDGDILVRTVDALEEPAAVGEVVVRWGPDGPVRVRDVAKVREGLADERTRSRVNGRRATILTVLKAREGDIVTIADRLKAIIDEERARAPEGLDLAYVQDGSTWVRERMDVAYSNGLQGFVLILLVLAAFLDPVSALWCAYGILSAIFAALFLLYVTGGTLNMLSIFGFILVLGMLDDDAITVVENVARWRGKGLPLREAIAKGASEVAQPVTAAIATTSAALLPLALMTGIMGKFMAEIPRPAIFALFASLLDVLIFMPSHIHSTAGWEKNPVARLRALVLERRWLLVPLLAVPPLVLGAWALSSDGAVSGLPRIAAAGALLYLAYRVWDRVRAACDVFMDSMRRAYVRLLRPVLRRRYLFLSGVLLAFVGAIVLGAFTLRFELVSTRDTPIIQIEVRAPAGTTLAEVEKIAERVEARVLELPPNEVKGISTTLGVRRHDRGFEYAREVAQVMVELHDPAIRPRDAIEIIEDLRARLEGIRGAEVVVEKMRGGPPVGKPVVLRISGDDWATLRAFADEVKAFVMTLPGAVDVEDDLRAGKREAVVRPLPDAAAMAGTTPGAIAIEARVAADGVEAAAVRRDGDEVKVRVRYPPERRARARDLGAIRVPTPAGPAPIANLARIEPGRGYASLRHYDGRRTVTVTADIERGGLESREANRRIREVFEGPARARSLSIAAGGEAEETAKSLRSLGAAALVGIALIAIILVLQFENLLQPLVIMATLPLAVIGVVLTLLAHTLLYRVTGIGMEGTMGLLQLIGLAALLGMVTNDGIVLVDFVNEARRRGAGRWWSIVRAGQQRFRPVLLASTTTAIGVMPMAYTLRGSSSFLRPMALVFGWGVLLATTLTLFVIPALLSVVDDVRERLKSSPNGPEARAV